MNKILPAILISFFAVFLGTQIAEGALMVPHWKSMEPEVFYAYYNQFGPSIGLFFTIMTIAAALIPVGLAFLLIGKPSRSRMFALLSTGLILLCIGIFYFYFKGANEQFYDGVLSAEDLAAELERWTQWHWVRVVLEAMSLIFLILSFHVKAKENRELI